MSNVYYIGQSVAQIAVALSQDIPALTAGIAAAPVLTGANVFAPISGVAITVTAIAGANGIIVNGTDIAQLRLNSSAAANRAISIYSQGGTAVGKVGSDGTQNVLTDSTNGDLCVAVAAGGAVRLGAFSGTTGLKLVAGAGTFAAQIGVSGNAPPAQSTGWGTATGGAVANNFNGAVGTLPQATAAIAQIITVLKAVGFLGT